MRGKSLAINGIIAALYVAVSLLIAPLAFSSIQFRISEIFNHLVVFNKKYFFGVVVGVFVANLFSPLGMIDLVFGVGMSVLALLATILSAKFITDITQRMIFNIAMFAIFSFLIAIELQIVFGVPFWIGWLTVAIGEIVVMTIGIPIMISLNKRLNFKELV
ncbi:QueT transporter family protein [Sporosarcina pasteurii]|uniref:Queuosine ECF transporter S component QueT n=1 Tax=Sporosarcina pasteurii TaxID=1474 RepID=A0A380BBM2_SPOPA|nr:QueT transporter family protein [Sporosarcina pasteurii]MDS9472841.1 QueT transporter family protein [Sporosarcina pasteurii]QBQ06395.1 QueT transporter family protein [Sporosarcina pasteurii]SUI98788.1 Queuosine precursor ECF transporter S component QueT [Sporosarcina pasteurii]